MYIHQKGTFCPGSNNGLTFICEEHSLFSCTWIATVCLRPHKKRTVYSIGNFVASWIKWLQMRIVPRLICTLIRKSQAHREIYPIFFQGGKSTWDFLEWNLRKSCVSKGKSEKNGCHALENLRCFCHPEKDRVDFTGRLRFSNQGKA